MHWSHFTMDANEIHEYIKGLLVRSTPLDWDEASHILAMASAELYKDRIRLMKYDVLDSIEDVDNSLTRLSCSMEYTRQGVFDRYYNPIHVAILTHLVYGECPVCGDLHRRTERTICDSCNTKRYDSLRRRTKMKVNMDDAAAVQLASLEWLSQQLDNSRKRLTNPDQQR